MLPARIVCLGGVEPVVNCLIMFRGSTKSTSRANGVGIGISQGSQDQVEFVVVSRNNRAECPLLQTISDPVTASSRPPHRTGHTESAVLLWPSNAWQRRIAVLWPFA